MFTGMETDPGYCIVMTTCPDQTCAEVIAVGLVEAGLAACVNVLPDVRSVYRWQGRIEKSTETVLLIKTRRDHYTAVERAIVSRHPYELPEVVAMPVVAGLPAYLAWIDAALESSKV